MIKEAKGRAGKGTDEERKASSASEQPKHEAGPRESLSFAVCHGGCQLTIPNVGTRNARTTDVRKEPTNGSRPRGTGRFFCSCSSYLPPSAKCKQARAISFASRRVRGDPSRNGTRTNSSFLFFTLPRATTLLQDVYVCIICAIRSTAVVAVVTAIL